MIVAPQGLYGIIALNRATLIAAPTGQPRCRISGPLRTQKPVSEATVRQIYKKAK